jgi:hypothetical protein
MTNTIHVVIIYFPNKNIYKTLNLVITFYQFLYGIFLLHFQFFIEFYYMHQLEKNQ